MQPLNHLYEALSPMFLASLLFGTSPIYSQEKNGKHQLKSSNIFKILTLAYLSIYTCIVIFGLSNIDAKASFSYFGNAMSNIGLVLDATGQIALLYIIYIFSFGISTNIKNVLSKIAMIDSVLQELGNMNNYRKTFWQQVILLCAGILAISFATVSQLYVIANQSKFRLNDSLWFTYYFPSILTFIMECQFSFTVFLIYQRFKIINGMMNDMSTTAQRSIDIMTPIIDVKKMKENEVTTSTTLRKIDTLMEVHDSVVDAATDLNTNYSVQILMCLTVLFIKSVFAAFFSYFELVVNGKTDISINWIIWLTINWHEILLITVTCHLASAQAQQTGVEIHKMIMNTQENIIRDKLIIFSQQVFHRPVDFTPCGLFSINGELVFTILGSATTYLLIMLQFQEGNEASCIISNSTVH